MDDTNQGPPTADHAWGADTYREVVAKVTDMVETRYSGDWREAFAAYAERNGLLSAVSVRHLLADAGAGTVLTRGAITRAVVATLDKDGDGHVSPAELEAELRKRA